MIVAQKYSVLKNNPTVVEKMSKSSGDDLPVINNNPKLFDYRAMIVDFIAGANGGTACVLAGQPFDTVKVKMQAFPSQFKNAFDCFKRTIREERVRGLYVGTFPALIANISENSILFLCYGRCQSVIQSLFNVTRPEDLTVFQKSCAGSIAAFFTSFALCPTELVKCKLQAHHQLKKMSGKPYVKSLGPLGLTLQILKSEGPLGLYHGFSSTCTREVVGYFFFFGGYDFSKYILTPPGKKPEDLGPLKVAFSGGIAGVCFWTSVFPADVIKSRIQTGSKGADQPSNFFKMLIAIGRNEGYRSLYRGLGPAIIRCFPANGALFLTYEATERLLK